MSDIRSLGPRGEAIHKTAEALKERNLVNDAQFKELTNGEIKPEDLQIADKALAAVQPSTKNAFQMLGDIGQMQQDFNTLKLDELKANRQKLREAQAGQGQGQGQAQPESQQMDFAKLAEAIKARGGSFVSDFLNAIASADPKTVIQNIRQ